MNQTRSAIVLLILALGVFSVAPSPARAAFAGKYFDYSVTVLMENNDLQTVLSQGGFEAQHASQSTIATGYSAVAHPSEPNYVALLGGSTNGISSDGVCCYTIQASNMIDRLDSAGVSWSAFAENATGSGTCSFSPPRHGDHFPFLDYADMNTSSKCTDFVSTTGPADPEFLSYLNSSQPANYIWLTPNDLDNGHNPPYIVTGDAFLATLVPKILESALFQTKRAALFIVYDEGNNVQCATGGSDCVYASWSGPSAKKGFKSSNPYTHYSYLHTIEDNWGLSPFTVNDANAPVMSEFFVGYAVGPTTSQCSPCPPTLQYSLVAGMAVLGIVVAVLILHLKSRSRRERSCGKLIAPTRL